MMPVRLLEPRSASHSCIIWAGVPRSFAGYSRSMPRMQDAPAAAVRRPVLPAAATGRLLAALAALLVVLTVLVALRWQPLMDLDHAVARWAFDRTHGHPALTAWRTRSRR
jgi:hypothetical protein